MTPAQQPETAALDALWDELYAAVRHGNDGSRMIAARRAIEAAARSAAPVLEALREIAEARRQRSACPNPATCMIPQAHSDDESWAEFAARLQRLAAAPPLREPEGLDVATLPARIMAVLLNGDGDTIARSEVVALLTPERPADEAGT